MPSPSLEAKKAEARKKGTVAAVTAAASVAAFAVGAPPVIGVLGLAGSAMLGYRWVRYRIQEGIRF
jgi:hypothetical protein